MSSDYLMLLTVPLILTKLLYSGCFLVVQTHHWYTVCTPVVGQCLDKIVVSEVKSG